MAQAEAMQQLILTRTQAEILEIVTKKGHASIDEFRDRVDDLRVLFAGGYLLLKVETTEWGISFELVPRKEYSPLRQHL